MIPQVDLFFFVFLKNLKTHKDISKLTDPQLFHCYVQFLCNVLLQTRPQGGLFLHQFKHVIGQPYWTVLNSFIKQPYFIEGTCGVLTYSTYESASTNACFSKNQNVCYPGNKCVAQNSCQAYIFVFQIVWNLKTHFTLVSIGLLRWGK